jgi:hypothetical protein
MFRGKSKSDFWNLLGNYKLVVLLVLKIDIS